MARKNGQNHDIESIYEPNIKSARYGEQEERVLARIICKIKEFILYITNSQKRSYRDAKIKKLEEFWRENAVGIGLYNECVLWWGVRFERLLAALKSKRHKQAQNCYVFGASVRWAFGMINASGPGIPTTYGWIWWWIQQL